MLYFVRHAQTDWNCEPARCQGWADVPLNAAGRRQAREQGLRLRDAGIQAIVSSHLRRAVETAELMREELDPRLPLRLDERLAETRRGHWESRTFADIIVEEPEAWRCYRERPEEFCFPGGESLVEQQRRVLAAVVDIAASGQTTLVVTHGGSIRLLCGFLDCAGVLASRGPVAAPVASPNAVDSVRSTGEPPVAAPVASPNAVDSVRSFHRVVVANGDVVKVPCAGLAARISAFLRAGESNAAE